VWHLSKVYETLNTMHKEPVATNVRYTTIYSIKMSTEDSQ